MIWAAILILSAVAVAPLALLLRRQAVARGERDPARALHRAQLLELDRDLTEGRILPDEHKTATLEVQRRLLAVADDKPVTAGAKWPVLAALVLVPVTAMGLYAVAGQPYVPTVANDPVVQAALKKQAEEAALIDQLRERLQGLDPTSPQAHQGYTLLGNVEEARGNDKAAAEAWTKALISKFDPLIAAEAAEAATRAEGRVSDASAALFRRALAEGPAAAPWRSVAEQRLANRTP